MNLSGEAVKRPIFTSMATAIIMILGAIALQRLPVDLMPDMSLPNISIITSIRGASPEEVESQITEHIESAVSSLPGLESIESRSEEGRSRVSVNFRFGTDIKAMMTEIRNRVGKVERRFPDTASTPAVRQFDPNAFPVLVLGAGSDLELEQTKQIVDDQVVFRLERVDGVAEAGAWGGKQREVQIRLDVERIKTLGIPITTVMGKIKAGNQDSPAGMIRKGGLDVRVRTPGEFTELSDLRDTVIAMRNDAPVRLHHIASVDWGYKDRVQYVTVNGRKCVQIAIFKQSGRNTVAVCNALLEEVERINDEIPQISLVPVSNSAVYIENSVNNVSRSALLGGGLAILILIFFLCDIRSTMVVSIAIPISLVATFALIYFGGLTINIMTLGGLALGVGMLVDNAIVVLEVIVVHRDQGMNEKEAAVSGARQVTTAIIASTITTLVVFLPLLFVEGKSGIMFKQLGMVVTFSLCCSLVVAITLVPALAARFLLTRAAHDSPNRVFQRFQVVLNALETQYRSLLGFSLRHKAVVIVATLLLLAGSVGITRLIPTEVMPDADEGEVRVSVRMGKGKTIEELQERFDSLRPVIAREVPEAVRTRTNFRVVQGLPRADMTIALAKRANRSRSSEEIASHLHPLLQGVPGIAISAREGRGFFVINKVMADTGARIWVEVRGHDMASAALLSNSLTAQLEEIPEVSHVRNRLGAGAPEEHIVIDRPKAEQFGFSVAQVGGLVRSILSGYNAGSFREGNREFGISFQLANSKEITMDQILDFTIQGKGGEAIALRNFVNTRSTVGPSMIERRDQERINRLFISYESRDGDVVIEKVRALLRAQPLPEGFGLRLAGDYEEKQKAFHELLLSFALAVVLIYMVMACQFESLKDPLVVMLSVPLAAVGVIVMLFLTDSTFNIQSGIGCIMLAGIVVNNAILLVDHINHLRREKGLTVLDAAAESGVSRMRPILMTAMTTILGLVPLALGLGEGGGGPGPHGPGRDRRTAQFHGDHPDHRPRSLCLYREGHESGPARGVNRAMSPFRFLFCLFLFLASPGLYSAAEEQPARPNILLIVCDDLNTHVTTSGYKSIQTPTLERLASAGMVFNRAFCQYPVCGPSRASFLSGLYPESTGVLNNKLDIRQTRPGTVSMPRFFKENGYWTAGIGKVFHNLEADQGEVAWTVPAKWYSNDELPVVTRARKVFEAEHGPADTPKNKKKWREVARKAAGPLNSQTPPGHGPSGLQDEQHKDGKNARHVISWLREKPYGPKPFFIALGIQKPHVPFLAPQRYFDLYPKEKIKFHRDAPNLWKTLPASAVCGRYKAFGFRLGKEKPALRRTYIQAYHACVTFVDTQIGLVLDELKAQGLWENTIILLTSDHGYHLGEHFLWGKVTLFDIGAKVPFLVRVPAMTKPGSRSETMVELIDIYPTLAELAGLQAPDHLQGTSLVPVLKNPEARGGKAYAYSVVSRKKTLGYALRNQMWRYGKWPDGEELYDLTRDPHERTNVAKHPAHAELLKQFRVLLAEKQAVARMERRRAAK